MTKSQRFSLVYFIYFWKVKTKSNGSIQCRIKVFQFLNECQLKGDELVLNYCFNDLPANKWPTYSDLKVWVQKYKLWWQLIITWPKWGYQVEAWWSFYYKWWTASQGEFCWEGWAMWKRQTFFENGSKFYLLCMIFQTS